MKLGFFTMPMHPPSRNYTETLKEDRAAVLLADELGFSEAFIGEHVTDVCESIPSCLAFIASVAHATKQIKLGSGTVNLFTNTGCPDVIVDVVGSFSGGTPAGATRP